MHRNLFFRNLLLGVGATLLTLSLLEGATRLLTASNTVLNINLGGFKSYHPVRGAQLRAGYRAKDISINSLGFLGSEFSIDPDPRTVRILAIGNSVTFSPPSRNYPVALQERLNATGAEGHVEVVVGAVPGYSSYEALNWHDELLHKLKPDITLIYLGWNDMGQFHPFGLRYKNENIAYRERTWAGLMMEHLTFLRLPYLIMGRMERQKPVELSPLTMEEKAIIDRFAPTHYQDNLTTLIEDLKRRGSDVFLLHLAGLITYPPGEQELTRLHFPRGMGKKLEIYRAVYCKYVMALEEVSRRTDTPIIDLRELIKTETDRSIFTDTVHITEEGADRFAAFIAASIDEKVKLLLDRKRTANPVVYPGP